MSTDEIIWRPDPAASERTHIARFLRTHGLSLEGLQQRSVEDIAWYWDAVQRRTSAGAGQRRSPAWCDLSRGVQWPRWFLGRPHEPGRELRGPAPGRPAARCPGHRLRGRGWRRAHADLRGARPRGGAARQRPPAPRRGRGRHRRRLPADGPGGRHRHPRRVADRRRLHAVLLGLRRPGGGDAARRRRRSGADHRRRLRPPGPAHTHEETADEAVASCPSRPPRDRPPPHRRRRALDARAATSGGTTRWPRRRRLPTRCRSRPTTPLSSSTPPAPPGGPRARCSPRAVSGLKNAHDWAYVFDMARGQPHVLGDRPRLADGARC